jgi:hypothetical protein
LSPTCFACWFPYRDYFQLGICNPVRQGSSNVFVRELSSDGNPPDFVGVGIGVLLPSREAEANLRTPDLSEEQAGREWTLDGDDLELGRFADSLGDRRHFGVKPGGLDRPTAAQVFPESS